MRGKREALASESMREATSAPATPPQNASMVSRERKSATFADRRQHIANRGAPFTGRVRVDTSASTSKLFEPSGAGGSPMKRVASTPSLQARTSMPAPGSQSMRDMFFVRQDNINFNASYGTPVREVRFSHPPKTPERPRPVFQTEDRASTDSNAFEHERVRVYVSTLRRRRSPANPHARYPTRFWRSSGRTTSSARRPRTSGCSAWRR